MRTCSTCQTKAACKKAGKCKKKKPVRGSRVLTNRKNKR